MLCWLLQGGTLLPAAPGTGSLLLPPAPLGSAIPGSELPLPPCWGYPGPFLLFSVTWSLLSRLLPLLGGAWQADPAQGHTCE